jgi:hypothetical protein
VESDSHPRQQWVSSLNVNFSSYSFTHSDQHVTTRVPRRIGYRHTKRRHSAAACTHRAISCTTALTSILSTNDDLLKPVSYLRVLDSASKITHATGNKMCFSSSLNALWRLPPQPRQASSNEHVIKKPSTRFPNDFHDERRLGTPRFRQSFLAQPESPSPTESDLEAQR